MTELKPQIDALASQLERAIVTGQRPAIEVRGLETGLWLADIAGRTHGAFRARQEKLLRVLAEKPDTAIVSMARYTEDELRGLLKLFVRRIYVPEGKRTLLRVFGEMELVHMACLSLTFPRSAAAQRVSHYAVMEEGFGLAMREYARRWLAAGGEASPSDAAFVLTRDAHHEEHPPARKTIRQYVNADRLHLPSVLRGVHPRDTRKGKEDDRTTLEGEIAVAVQTLVDELKEKDEDDLVALWLGGKLGYIPHAAESDLRNRFFKLRGSPRRKELICPFCEIPVSSKTRVCAQCGVSMTRESAWEPRELRMGADAEDLLPDPSGKTADYSTAEQVAAGSIERTVLKVFRHTKAQRKILRTLLTAPGFNRSEHGAIEKMAEMVHLRRETVSRYFAELNLHKPAIDKAFQG